LASVKFATEFDSVVSCMPRGSLLELAKVNYAVLASLLSGSWGFAG